MLLGQLGNIGTLLGSVYAIVSLATWSPLDPSFSRASAGAVRNAAGPLGAWLADFLFQTLGHGAWLVSLVGAAALLRLAGRRLGSVVRVLAGLGLAWTALCAIGLVYPAAPGQDFPAAGLVGVVSAELLAGLFGPAGAWIVLLGLVLFSVTVATGLDWSQPVGSALDQVESKVPRVAGASVRFGRGALSNLVGVGGAVRERLALPLDEHDGDWTDAEWDDLSETGWEDEGSVAAEELSVAPSVAAPAPAPAPAPRARRGRTRAEELPSVAISIHADVEPSLGVLPVPTALPAELPEGASQLADPPTRVAERELVEVEWETTGVVRSQAGAAPAGGVPVRLGPASFVGPASVADPAAARPAEAPPVAPAAAAPEVPPPAPRPSMDDYDIPRADAAPPAPEPALPRREGPVSVAPPAPRPPASGVARNVEVATGAIESGGSTDDGLVIDAADDAAFELPHMGLLDRHERDVANFDETELRALADTLERKLADFGVKGEVVAIRPGPVITTYEYSPAPGIKLSKIAALEDDIAMALKALRVRIVAPIPGKGVVGFEVPNKKRLTVWMRDILSSESFRKNKRQLPIALGKSVEGKVEISDLAKCPHLLIAGTTGSGKSVGVNAMLMSMLYTRTPDELRMILIDPKMLEFELYQEIPHLLHPVVTDPQLANAALKWSCDEMDARYRLLARWGCRNIASYNKKVRKELEDWTPQKARKYAPKGWPACEPPPAPRVLPYIVIVIDELADLMMVAAKEVEVNIARIAQKARAAGIHLIVATQRPEKTVVTGIIKANLPSRIAFQVRSKLDGRIILDQGGAESLLGKGDMLFLPPGVAELVRCHGPFVTDDEVRNVCDFLRAQGSPVYEAKLELPSDGDSDEEIEYDELYDLAVAYVAEEGKASTSMIQRQFKIGYNRAARMIEVMEKEGVVGPADGARPRKVLVGGYAAV